MCVDCKNLTMSMRSIFILALWIPIASCLYEIGGPCPNDTGIPKGVCTLYENCPIAWIMVDIRKIEPMYCFIKGSVRVVCCPKKWNRNPTNEMSITSIATPSPEKKIEEGNESDTDTHFQMDFLEALKAGIFRSNGIVCRFDGNYPLTCYRQEYPTYTVDLEQDTQSCPKLPWPEVIGERDLSPHLQVALAACRYYSLEGSLCIPTNTSDHYVRNDCLARSKNITVSDAETVKITQFPHMALIGVSNTTQIQKKNKNIIWYGGGSLISEYFILTAGHVILYDMKEVEYAMLGATNKAHLKTGVIFQVVRAIKYPDYDINLKYHDIALLELNRRVTFSEFIRPLCLMVPGLKITHERIIAGWGRISSSEGDTDKLREVIMYEMPSKLCEDKFEYSHFKWDSETMLCAKAMTNANGKKSDSCKGDSGGPLMARVRGLLCSFVAVGVVSWGIRCGVGLPGIYTNVAYLKYLEWISDTVWPVSVKQLKDAKTP